MSKLGRNRVAIRFGRHALTVIFCGVIVFLHAYYCLIALAIGLGDTNSIPNFATLPIVLGHGVLKRYGIVVETK